ncbi:S-layer homology domain-containing protein [Paenibacillus luteus]|uniref:CAP and S-layer homology domain-containing protein n=1 Tax=Paenibacillus luteus TaxID=2545753 RepID=UPI00114299B7|nr:S-layer homology domain-containing protein [Paenibacillus luteus]
MNLENTIPRSLFWHPLGKLILCAGLLIAVTLYNPSNRIATDTAYASDDTYSYTNDQLAALAFLNEARVRIGAKPLKLNTAITKAAVAHAAYFNANHTGKVTLSAHDETAGKPGFTGVSAFDRMKAAGWNTGTRGYSYGEVMHFNQKSSTQATQGWLDTAYHRAILLNPAYDEVGIGLVNGTAVMDFGNSSPSTADGIDNIYVYPYNKQTNVSVGFYGNEIPNPLQQFDAKYSGYIISASVGGKLTAHNAVITDESGATVPFYEEEYLSNTLFLFPKSVLKGSHTYSVSLDYEVEGGSGKLNKSWSFKTGEGHKLSALSPKKSQIVISEGEVLQLEIEGLFNDGVTESLVDGITYTSSNNTGLSISLAGEIKGLKAGNNYSVTAKLGGVSTKVGVNVLPKLKIKQYQGSNPAKLSDINGHAAASSINWAMTNGIITGYDNGTFLPNAYVSEAEFWTMMLKTYKVDINAYGAKVTKHWADAAYKIAADRDFSLDGIHNIANRSKPITRLKVSELFSSADGVRFNGYENVQYVLSMGYMEGKKDNTLSGFGGSDFITRGEAAQLLNNVHLKLESLRGRSKVNTPLSELPPMPELEVYKKPAVLSDKMIVAEFRVDHTLTVEGKFKFQAGKPLILSVQTRGKKTQRIEDVNVSLDSEGNFTTTIGPYEQESLNIYLYTDEIIYWIAVQYDTMNVSQYTQ